MPVEGGPGFGWGARLPVERVGPQDVRGAVGLEVDPGDQGVAIQEWQHVVAVDLQVGRDVDLQPVVEAEQRQGPIPLPDRGVERAQQSLGVHRPRDADVLVQVCRPPPSVDADPGEVTGGDEDSRAGRACSGLSRK